MHLKLKYESPESLLSFFFLSLIRAKNSIIFAVMGTFMHRRVDRAYHHYHIIMRQKKRVTHIVYSCESQMEMKHFIKYILNIYELMEIFSFSSLIFFSFFSLYRLLQYIFVFLFLIFIDFCLNESHFAMFMLSSYSPSLFHSNINHHNLIKINSINFIWTEEEKQKKKRTEKRMSY